MAREATLISKQENPLNFTCADATGIEKGTLLQLTDGMVASAASTIGQFVAGICASEKIANNGITQVAVYRKGIFKMTLSGSANCGDNLVIQTGSNYVSADVTGTVSGAKIVGKCLESKATGQTVLVSVNL